MLAANKLNDEHLNKLLDMAQDYVELDDLRTIE